MIKMGSEGAREIDITQTSFPCRLPCLLCGSSKAATSSCQDLKKKKLQEIRPLVLLLSNYYPPLHSLAARAVPAIPCHYPCIINANSAVSSPLMAVLKEEAGSRETLTISQGLFFSL